VGRPIACSYRSRFREKMAVFAYFPILGCFRLRNRVGRPIACSYRSLFLRENGCFRLFCYSMFSAQEKGGPPLLPAPIAACFCEKMAVFAYFPYSKAVFGSGIGWALIACSYSSLFLRENGLFFAYFPNPQAVFGSGIGCALIACSYSSLLCEKMACFSPNFPNPQAVFGSGIG